MPLAIAPRPIVLPPPEPLPPLPPLLLDIISAPATNAYSCYHKLRRAYDGFAIRVRRTPDNLTKGIGFIDDFLDVAALLAFVGTGSGFVDILYDEGIHGRHIDQITPANQPRIVNAGVLDRYPSGGPAMVFDGSNDRLFRRVAGNSTGLTGSPDVTVGVVSQGSGAGRLQFVFGRTGTGSGTGFCLSRDGAALMPVYKTHYGTRKHFTAIHNFDAAGGYYVVQHTAGGTTHTGVIRSNGVNLAPVSVTGSPLALSLLDQNLEFGGGSYFASSHFSGKQSALILFNAVLAGAELAAFEAELAAHLVPPPIPEVVPPPNVGLPPAATYSLYDVKPTPVNRAWLTVATRAVPPPGAPVQLEAGVAPRASYSLYSGAPPLRPNIAWLAIASRVVPPDVAESEQGDPLPILFI